MFGSFKDDPEIKIYFMTNQGNAVYKLDELGVCYKLLHFSKGLRNVFYVAQNEKELIEFCKHNSIDIIHTHHRYPELVANNVKKSVNIKTVATAHSIVSGFSKSSFKSDKIIAVSNTVYNLLVNDYLVPKEKVEIMYNCIRPVEAGITNRCVSKKDLGVVSDDFLFLFVGRGTKLKGADILIKAFSKILKAYKNASLIMVSDQFESSVKKLIDSPKIKIVPPSENIYKYYLAADTVVLPSLQESLSYVMLESGLFKKCFIGSKVGGMSEFINSNNALLVEPKDEQALYNQMEYIINNKEVANRLGSSLYKDVLPLTDCSAYYSRLKEIYKGVLN